MSPATPTPSSGTLPKSNYHRNHDISTAVSTTAIPAPPDVSAVITDELSSFTHPEHVVPPPNYAGMENLVVVCCHAIFHPDASSPDLPLHSPYHEGNWLLAPFQKSNPETGKPGEHETFMAHILAGMEALHRASPSSHVPGDTLLVFSGGATKTEQTPLTEAQSYYNAALAYELSQGGEGIKRFGRSRILLEEHATDSFQNLLFSILLFRRTTGIYPKQIRVITHAFKARRFLDLHAPAIKWPQERVQVQGIDPVMSKTELDETIKGEGMYGFDPWLKDPFGVGEMLGKKRKARGWDGSVLGELTDELEESVVGLFEGTIVGQLPWTMST